MDTPEIQELCERLSQVEVLHAQTASLAADRTLVDDFAMRGASRRPPVDTKDSVVHVGRRSAAPLILVAGDSSGFLGVKRKPASLADRANKAKCPFL